VRCAPRSENLAEVEALMKATAELDDHHVTICIQQEPGSAGKAYVDHLTRRTLRGFYVRPDRPTGDKYTRAKPMSTQARAGNFKLKRAAWNNAFLEELEQAGPDDRSYDHDDQWDAASSAFNHLCENSPEMGYMPVKDPEQSNDYDSRDDRNNSYGFPANFGKGAEEPPVWTWCLVKNRLSRSPFVQIPLKSSFG
jgi:predicted phage terminase large subunit-like protein